MKPILTRLAQYAKERPNLVFFFLIIIGVVLGLTMLFIAGAFGVE